MGFICVLLLPFGFILGRIVLYFLEGLAGLWAVWGNDNQSMDSFGVEEAALHFASMVDGLHAAPQLIFQGYLLAQELSRSISGAKSFDHNLGKPRYRPIERQS